MCDAYLYYSRVEEKSSHKNAQIKFIANVSAHARTYRFLGRAHIILVKHSIIIIIILVVFFSTDISCGRSSSEIRRRDIYHLFAK